MTNGPESEGSPRRSRRAADVPVDAGKGSGQRESQQRARDREALRAYKALTDSSARPASVDNGAPPTRRQLRLQQQRAAQAAAEERRREGAPQEPAREDAHQGGDKPAVAQRPGAGQSDPEQPDAQHSEAQHSNAAEQKTGQASVQPQSPKPGMSAAPKPAASKSGTSTFEAPKPAATKPAASKPAASMAAASAPPSRRARRRAEEAADQSGDTRATQLPVTPAPSTHNQPQPTAKAQANPDQADKPAGRDTAPAADPNADVADMSVEQALAAREALEGQARNQVAMMEAMRREDPYSVDLELLAQQKALAERAAVLNKRTQNIQRLSEQNEQRKPQTSDPTTAHNLAMVTPLEFVRVPGLDRPVMKRPSTAHVPLVTDRQVQADARGARTPAKERAGSGTPEPKAAPNRRSSRGNAEQESDASAEARHARILARADALMNAPLDPEQGARPIGARSAFGLDPLDVMTAGLGRTRRIRWVSFGLAGAGFAALVTGILLMVSGFGS